MAAQEDEAGGLPAGVSVGHWTDLTGRTGCSVILVPDGAVGGVDVRGGAPGTLGTDALHPGRVIQEAHAVLLTGGSAFGLAAATGILRYLEERGVGAPFGTVTIPIVAGAVIFDLLTGDARARPDAEAGYAACAAATRRPAQGAIGAGTGATVAKAGGGEPRPGGLGVASAPAGDATVTAVMVANSLGGIWDDERHEWVAPLAPGERPEPVPGANTTIGVVVTDAALTREQAHRMATVAHDGIARAVRPAHTSYDGDTVFCLATGMAAGPQAGYDQVEVTGTELVARAIAAGVRAAQPAGP
jgi:L-aminopeptidase/D-esterase-like protein